MRIPLFRIWYSTTYTTLLIILLLLLAITPADTIYQSIKVNELQKLFVVGGVYFLTFLIVLLVYSTRIYTNRTVLQAIPKEYVPIEQGEVGGMVRRMVVKHLRRSAIIAWDSRPKDIGADAGRTDSGLDEESSELEAENKEGRRWKPDEDKHSKKRPWHHSHDPSTIIPVSAKSPPWGHISHPGWASPSSPDLPNLQYSNVVCELPNLIEAKAVSLAPPDPILGHDMHYPDNAPPLPDAHVVMLLQRPRAMGLREYLGRLASFRLIDPPDIIPSFLAQYEHARFSTCNLSEPEFRSLMATFAQILSGMTEISPAALDEMREQDFDPETQSLARTQSTQESTLSGSSIPYQTPLPHRQHSPTPYSESETASFSSAEEAINDPRTPPATRRYSQTQSARSLRTVSDTGSVVVHTPQMGVWAEGDAIQERPRRSPSTILPNSSTSSLSSAHASM